MGFYLPNQFIKESAKDEEWFMAHVRMAQNHAQGIYGSSFKTRDEQNFDNYNGVIDPVKIKGKVAPLGLTSPTLYKRYGLTRALVNNLYSEFLSMELDSKCSSVNQEAILKKDQYKLNLITNKLLAESNKEMSKQLGFDIETENPDLPVPDDIDKYMKMNHREVVEDIVDGMIEYVLTVKGKREQINYAFLNYLITGKAKFKVEEEDGDPSFRQIDSRNDIAMSPWGTDFTTENESNGEVSYMNKSQIIHNFYNCQCDKKKRLTKNEAKEILNMSKASLASLSLDHSTTRFKPLRLIEGTEELEFSVVTLQWRGKKVFSYKESESKKQEGLIYRKNVNEDYKAKKGENMRSYLFDELYEATLIADKYLVKWGPVENQQRSIDSIQKTSLDYIGMEQGATNNTQMSLVEKLEPFDEMDSDLFYSIRQALNRAGGKAIVYDMAQLPTEFFGNPDIAMKKVTYHLKESNILWINTRKGGTNKSSFNQYKDFDLGLSNSISNLINLKAMNLQSAELVTGISSQRNAQIEQYETSGNAERGIEQSVMRTREYFVPFNKLLSMLFGKLANKGKFIWKEGKKVAYVAGDGAAKIIEIIQDLPLSDYGFYIGDTVKDRVLKQKIEQVSTAMLQNTQDPRLMLEVFKIMKADSASEAEAIFERGIETMEKMNAQQQEAEQQTQLQVAEVAKETAAIEDRTKDKDNATKVEIANIKAMSALDVVTMQDGTKRDIEKGKLQKDFYMKNFEENKAKREASEGGSQETPSTETSKQ